MDEAPLSVLLIASDADATELVKRHLADAAGSPERFTVESAARVSSATHALAKDRYGALLFDLQVQHNVGLEGFRLIHAQHPELPVVLLTGVHDEPLARQALKQGAQDYLIKGTIDFCALRRAIRHAIEKKELARAVERMVDDNPAPKLVVDEAALVLFANTAAAALFGAPAGEITGKPFAYPRGRGETPPEMSVAACEWNGAPARMITFVSAPRAEDPKGVKHDEAEKRRLDDIKSRLMRRLSHEMRNTLSTVKTAIFCLKDLQTGPLSARQSRLADMIARNVDRQVHIFDKMTALAAFESGSLKINLRRLDLPALLAEIARESSFGEAKLHLEVETPGRLPPVEGDADLILQVLQSLLDNAFRHAKDKVSLRAEADEGGGVRISVFNDGGGIAKDRLAGLFTPFAELDARMDDAGFNGGLGLTMSREIIEGHKGRIWAESDDAGTRVSFVLPRYAEPGALHGGLVREGATLS